MTRHRLRGPSRLLETFIGFGLVHEDMYIVKLQNDIKSGAATAPTDPLQSWTIYHSGNLENGFVYAIFFDTVMNQSVDAVYGLVVKKTGKNSRLSKSINYFRQDTNRINIAAGMLSSLAICFFETTGIGNTPNLQDIPAGVAGALLYSGLRYGRIRKFRAKNNFVENELLQPSF